MNLDSLSNALADAVQAAAPSLLAVTDAEPRRRPRGGTATVIAPGRAATSAHLVGDRARVKLPDGSIAEARVVGADAQVDLAILEVDASLPPIAWGPEPRVGGLAVPVARRADGIAATLGVFQAIGGAWSAGGARIDAYYDVDGTLPGGFSGGPLLAAGGAVAINTHRLAPGGAALPRATVERVAAALEAGRAASGGYLGIGGTGVALTAAQAAAAGQPGGLVVLSVQPGGPSDGALRVGDVVLRVDGRPIAGVNELRAALDGKGAGTPVALDVLAGTAVEARPVALGARPAC